jgi:protein CpxP
MKNVLIICLALLTFSLQAQPGNDEGKHHRNGKNMDYTPEQTAELRTKKMTLHLELNEQQEKKIYSLMLNKATKRKEKSGSNKEEHKEEVSFEKRKEMLDNRIEEKKELKSILTKEQFDKWERNMQSKNRKKSRSKKGK